MRRALFLAVPLAAMIAAPAAARDSQDDAEMRKVQTEMVDKLNDPKFQDGMADMMVGLMKALSTMKVAPLMDAAGKMDPKAKRAKVDPDATLGDMMAKGDPNYMDRMEDGTRVMTKSMGVMAAGMAKMMPVMMDMAKDMGAQMEKSMGKTMKKVSKDLDKELD